MHRFADFSAHGDRSAAGGATRYRVWAVNIAVIVGGGMTETIQATPLLRTLRAGSSQARITLLCPSSGAAVAQGVPAVDELVPLAALNAAGSPAAMAAVWVELRRRRVDAGLLCSTRASLRLALYLAGVPQRLGPAGGLSSVLLTAHTPVAERENSAATWLRLAALFGLTAQVHAPGFEPGPEARREADRLLHATGLTDGRLLIAIAPGTALAESNGVSPPATAWDPERYALLANLLAQRHAAGVIFLGSPGDRAVIEQTMMDLGIRVPDFSSEPDIRVIAGLLARCDLLVAGDSPLLHLAAAVGTPAVGLFGPTDGRARGPYGSDHRIIQALPVDTPAEPAVPPPSPMTQIRVEDVLAGIEATL